MKLLNTMRSMGPKLYYSREFKQMIEDHLPYLKNHSSTATAALDPMLSYKYMGDLTGLLYHLNIPSHLHFVILRLNDYSSYTDFKGTETSILLIEQSVISNLANTLKTRLSKRI
jgi:hypothetical protein